MERGEHKFDDQINPERLIYNLIHERELYPSLPTNQTGVARNEFAYRGIRTNS